MDYLLKQGLLFKDAPEPLFELFCTWPNNDNILCNKQFKNTYDYSKHLKEVHACNMNYKLSKRPHRRWNCTEQEAQNLQNRKCWCGKEKKDFEPHQITYCCKKHNDQWWIKTDYVDPHRRKFLKENGKCRHCGLVKPYSYYGDNLEVDHIIAIMFGGHPWDERNLQTLCHDCHVLKTNSDRRIQKFWRDTQYYDPVFARETPQQLMEQFTQA